jgi:predicted short-subunit dehydrogenase-like oxidoreductase (DUF2520 family)
MKDRAVGIVGAGRVGTALGVALRRAGYEVVGIAARSAGSRDRAERILPEVPVLDAATVARTSDILVLSVSDDAIASVCGDLATNGHLRRGQIVMHVSGAHGLKALASAVELGAVPFAIHPAMTFPGLDSDADNLVGLAYAITARPAERADAEQLVRDLGGVPVWIDDDDRTLYHAALVLGANNLITLTAAAMEALSAAGVEDPGFVIGPLMRTSLENALRHGDQALTGPVRRADIGTIDAHLDALRGRTPDLVMGYLQFGLVTARRAKQAALNSASDLDRVIALLEERAAQEQRPNAG